ncbi:MAG: GAF domain-containing protein, partial [Acholeplasmataceae bacterium]|nr:GAF domain-containing protein [Acholeplasmataceae bacterium]
MQKKLTQTKSIKDTNIKLRTIAFKITNDLLNADPNTYADTLHRVFGLIGQTIHVDRIYLFEYRFDEDRLLGICEWSNKGILPHIKNNLSVTIHQDLDMLIHHHQNKAYVAVSDITTLNHDTYLYQVLSEQGVQSMVAHPVFTGDQLFGFVGIEDNKQKRVWDQDEINLFGILVQLIGNVLDKRQISNEKDQLHELVKMANQAKSDFLSNMSHEIKTPLSGIYNAIYLLGTAHLTPEQKQYLNMAQTSVDNLTGMINDVLDISMIEAGKMEIDNQLFNLEDELVKIVHMQSRLAQEKKLEIIFDFDYGINFMLLGDYLKLRKIMMNLFNNAIKYTNQGSITVKATQLEDDKKAKIEFKVIDTGIGIDEKHKHHLFDSFFQVDASISKKYAGAGLGLAISNHLVHLLGGSFSFESQPNHGSEFKVILSFDKGALHTYPSTHLLNA